MTYALRRCRRYKSVVISPCREIDSHLTVNEDRQSRNIDRSGILSILEVGDVGRKMTKDFDIEMRKKACGSHTLRPDLDRSVER